MHAVAAIACLAMALWNLHPIGFEMMDGPDVAVSVIYMAALVALPFKPVPSAVAIVIVTVAEGLLPSDAFVQSLWGFCYALAVFAMEGLIVPAAAAVAVVCGIAWAQGDRPMWPVFHHSSFEMLPFMLFAAALGVSLRMWRVSVREHSRAEARHELLLQENRQYGERLRLLHELHGSVAGSLTYAIWLCRELGDDRGDGQGGMDPSALRERACQVEGVLAQTLGTLRREVIDPTRRLVDEHEGTVAAPDGEAAGRSGGNPTGEGESAADVDGLAGNAEIGAIVVERRMRQIADRLNTVGLRCETLTRGDLTVMGAARLDLMVRIIDEMGNNMLKYASPGPCAIAVTMMSDGSGARIWSSNMCAGAGAAGGADTSGGLADGSSVGPEPPDGSASPVDDPLSGGVGLPLMRRSLKPYGGTVTASREEGEWSIAVMLPAPAHAAA